MEKALLVVDVIKGFAEKGFDKNMYCENTEKIKPKLIELIEYMRSQNIPVIYCCDSHEKNDPELKENSGPWEDHCMKGSKSSEIVDWLPTEGIRNVKKSDFDMDSFAEFGEFMRIDKRTYSSFFDTPLDDLLKEKGIKEVYIAGLVTSICVQHTAAGAFFNGYKISIADECCADINEEKHKTALEYMKNNYSAGTVRIRRDGAVVYKSRLEKVL
ncbi:MAG: cysteine hydrolase [Candidatus Parvarchaeota archaeon]|jgi:nicotinamidase-related amidase|nr:cysteine hydrolase [Candidatus Parvarchaeota archaeon]MCL5420380.1 cysteine hydrolase [Candidatus Parvarchaeota archaeon]